jgi:hypothetical protein
MARQGGAGQISTCTSFTPHAAEGDKNDDRALERRGEVWRVGVLTTPTQRNATQRMHAFWWRLAFLLVMDGPEDRIG